MLTPTMVEFYSNPKYIFKPITGLKPPDNGYGITGTSKYALKRLGNHIKTESKHDLSLEIRQQRTNQFLVPPSQECFTVHVDPRFYELQLIRIPKVFQKFFGFAMSDVLPLDEWHRLHPRPDFLQQDAVLYDEPEVLEMTNDAKISECSLVPDGMWTNYVMDFVSHFVKSVPIIVPNHCGDIISMKVRNFVDVMDYMNFVPVIPSNHCGDTSTMTTRDFVNVMRACGMAASGRRGRRAGNGPGRKKRKKKPGRGRGGPGGVPRGMVQTGPAKYVDTQVTGAITGAGSLNQISDVAQGISQSQRLGDRIHIDRFIWNYTLYQDNADIVNTVRLMVVQFIPSTFLLGSSVTDFLQTASPTSLYNHELRSNYNILYDKVYRMSGITTAPTNTSAIGRNNVIIRPKKKMINFALASTTGGTNQCFVLLVGDSVIAPYVGITSTIRMVYRDG